MKWMRQAVNCLYAYKAWYLLLIATNVLFIYLAWLAYPETFPVLVKLMIGYTVTVILLSVLFVIRKHSIVESFFQDFLADPNEENEEELCRVASRLHRSFIREMGKAMRRNQIELNDQVIELTDYENYIEGWVHEIKKPLSLLSLVIDSRRDEMTDTVRRRMCHVRDQMVGDVEQILFYARLGAVHKDYMFAPLKLLAFCRETVERNQSIVDESVIKMQFVGEEIDVISDAKGLAFMLEQIIFNSINYATQYEDYPVMTFEIVDDGKNDSIILRISDNGPGVSAEDMPFIFDKGFTGERRNTTEQATGIGLFLVSKMAADLAIQLEAKSERGGGLMIFLRFPYVI